MNQVKDTDEIASVYVPAAINFVRQIGKTGIDYGVIVAGYEPGKPAHDIYKIGDIIVAVNKTLCKNFDEFQKIRADIPKDSGYTATILRQDGSGTLQMVDVDIPAGQPKVALLNLRESE
jgi:S1-C subfamily serine protease